MTETELIDYLGLQEYSAEVQAKFIAALPPEQRALFDKMLETEQDIKLWQEGVGPEPTGVILCREHKRCGRCAPTSESGTPRGEAGDRAGPPVSPHLTAKPGVKE